MLHPTNNETTRAAIRDLLKMAPLALRGLSACSAFDFAAPIKAAKIRAPYTVRKAMTAAGVADPDAVNGVIILYGPDRERWNHRPTAAFIFAGGSVGICAPCGCLWTSSGLDTFYRKQDFNDRRKADGFEAIAIFQDLRYLLTSDKRPRAAFNPSARYILESATRASSGHYTDPARRLGWTTDRTYISAMILRETAYNRPFNQYAVARPLVQIRPNAGTVPTEAAALDKSGYPVFYYRDKLAARVKALKAERAKAAADAANYASELAALAARVDRINKIISKTFAAASGAAALLSLVDIIGSRWTGYAATVRDFETVRDRIARKEYATPDAQRRALDGIAQKLAIVEHAFN